MEDIEVEVVHDGPPEAERPPVEWRRWVVPVCAVVLAVAALVVAWSQVRLLDATEQEQCLHRASFLAYGPAQNGRDQDETYLRLVEECGVELPPELDQERSEPD